MIPLLTVTILLGSSGLPQVQSCIGGFQYVPPPPPPCQPCQRDSSGKLARIFFKEKYQCCEDATTTTSTELKNTTGCGVPNTNERILGGQEATENQFPWQCALLAPTIKCGATLISCDPVIIVTAAQCYARIISEPNDMKVSCGGHRRGSLDTNEQRLDIAEIIKHPDYDDATDENDIAIVKVNGSFDCRTDTVFPACLPNTERYTYVGWEDTIVSGWGRWGNGAIPSDLLRWVKISPPVSDATCINYYETSTLTTVSITSNMICAGLPGVAGFTGSGFGDNGGPLVTRATGVDTGYSLVGVSTGLSGGRPFYDYYTEVSHYLPWIADQYDLTFPSTEDTSGRRKFRKNKNKNKNKKKKQKNKKKSQKSRKGQ